MLGCSRVIAHSLVRWFGLTGISIDAYDRRDARKQYQDKTVSCNLHARIDVSGSSRQATIDATHLNVLYQTIKTKIGTNNFCVIFFYCDPLLIPNATSQTHDGAAVFQLHRSTVN